MNSTQTSTQQSFIKGTAVLALAGLIVKVIGVAYRIPLVWILGAEGVGIYQKVFPIYTWLLMFSTSGIPTAIAKLVSEHLSQNDRRGAHRVYSVALWLLLIIGSLTTAFMIVFRGYIASSWLSDPLTEMSVVAIAPSLFFVAAFSAYRGYFQGMHNMVPTASTQVVEQVVKLAAGLYLAYRFVPYGIAAGAAGALLGISISEMLAFCVTLIIYVFDRRKWKYQFQQGVRRPRMKTTIILRQLLTVSIPIILSASILPIVGFADAVIVTDRLVGIGYSEETSRALYGILTGMVNNLTTMPTVISLALSVSMVPAVAAAWVNQFYQDVRHKTMLGLKLSIVLTLPAAVGLMVLSTPILKLLYGGNLTVERLEIANILLCISSVGVVFLAMIQTLSGVLNGLGRMRIPVMGLAVGAVIKIISSLYLIGIPSIFIYGAPIGTVLCYIIAFLIDIIMVQKITKVQFSWWELVIKPLFANAIMAAATWGTYRMVISFLPNSVSTLIAIIVAILVYIAAVLMLGCIGTNELKFLPKGDMIVRIFGLKERSRGKHRR